MTWALYSITRHPETQTRILAEQKHKDALPSYVEISPSKYPFTYAVLYETLRLYPPVPVEIKESTEGSIFPDGTILPAGGLVVWTAWAMGRSRHIWGVDADEFRPERWLQSSETSVLMTKSPFEYPVFNAGPRSCLGKRMAELLSVSVLSGLLQRYVFVEAGDVSKARISQNSLTLPMAGGLPCRLYRR